MALSAASWSSGTGRSLGSFGAWGRVYGDGPPGPSPGDDRRREEYQRRPDQDPLTEADERGLPRRGGDGAGRHRTGEEGGAVLHPAVGVDDGGDPRQGGEEGRPARPGGAHLPRRDARGRDARPA